MQNYGDLEEALDDARQLEGTINALTDKELQESIELDNTNLTDLYETTDDNKILFSPQIEVFEPFAAHVDASRTNMSAKQLLQVVTSDNCETPFIINKNYQAMTNINSPFVSYAEEDGLVLYSNFNFLIIYYLGSNTIKTLYIPDTKKMTNNTITLKYKISQETLKFKEGDTLFDYTGQSLESHVPKIGYRTNIMYGSFYGYTADDAFVISQAYADRTRIDYSKKIFIPISKEIKYLKNSKNKYFTILNEITDENYLEYFKIDSSDSMLSEFNNISERQSKIFGSSVDSIPGGTVKSFKVHRINKKTFDELEEEYIYTPGLIQELKTEYERQLYIKKDIHAKLDTVFNDKSQAIEMTNEIFSQWESADVFATMSLDNIADDYKIEKENIDYIVEVEIYKSEETVVGDKFANIYAGKGIVSLILPNDVIPKDDRGDPFDVIFNPLGLFGRNNWGTIFEIGLSKIIRDIEDNIEDKLKITSRLEFIRQKFINLYDSEYSQRVLDLLYEFDSGRRYDEFKTSVIKDGFYLLVDNFPGITYKDFIDDFITPYEEKYEINIVGKIETCYTKELMQFMRDRGFVSSVFGSDVVQDVNQEVFAGKNYWIKLFHTSNSKYNSISFANSYSKSTGEPPRGRTKNGGCHISWQSTAALIGHMENNPASKELRTIKSDAVQDKNNFSRKMIKDGFYTMKPKYKSQTVNTLNNGLNMLCLKFSGIVDNNDAESFIDRQLVEECEEPCAVTMDDLFIGSSKSYERQDNLDTEIDDESEVIPHDSVTGEILKIKNSEESIKIDINIGE